MPDRRGAESRSLPILMVGHAAAGRYPTRGPGRRLLRGRDVRGGERDPVRRTARRSGRRQDAMLLYALTIFLSAFLLFQVQPVIARAILPWFGGSAAVWTTC